MSTPTPPPPSCPVFIEWFSVDAKAGIRVTGTFDVTLAVTGISEERDFEAIEREIEAAILAALVKHAGERSVN
jgi:hypothetical protein